MSKTVDDPTPPIPEFLAALAVKNGIPTDKVPDEWADYALWSETHYPTLGLGGQSWLKWVQKAAAQYKTLKLEDRIALERAAAERQARLEVARAQEAVYQRDAVPFGDYCASLERRELAGDLLAAHEADVVRFWEGLDQSERAYEWRRPMALFARYLAWLNARAA